MDSIYPCPPAATATLPARRWPKAALPCHGQRRGAAAGLLLTFLAFGIPVAARAESGQAALHTAVVARLAEARAREAREREARAREAREREKRAAEAREREAREREARERAEAERREREKKERLVNNIVRDLRQARALAEKEREARARRAEEARRARMLANEQAKKNIETLVNDWLATMRIKKPCDRFWYGGDAKTLLYSVVDWKIFNVEADAAEGSGTAIVKIDSSNKGGQPIRENWTVTARKEGGAWKIYSVEDHSAQ